MRRYQLTKTVLAAGVAALLSSYAQADDYSATLSGFNEIGALAGPTGAVLSNGKGTLRLVLDRKPARPTMCSPIRASGRR